MEKGSQCCEGEGGGKKKEMVDEVMWYVEQEGEEREQAEMEKKQDRGDWTPDTIFEFLD